MERQRGDPVGHLNDSLEQTMTHSSSLKQAAGDAVAFAVQLNDKRKKEEES
jgi:hypothetical protein